MKYLKCVIGIFTVVCILVTAAACRSQAEPHTESQTESETTAGKEDGTQTFYGYPIFTYTPPEEIKAEQER